MLNGFIVSLLMMMSLKFKAIFLFGVINEFVCDEFFIYYRDNTSGLSSKITN